MLSHTTANYAATNRPINDSVKVHAASIVVVTDRLALQLAMTSLYLQVVKLIPLLQGAKHGRLS
eukprot:510316-Pelagomonas_calceolata.AAC.2